MKRYLHCLFCDDVRQEIGNKLSLMGVYQSVMFVPQMPVQLQKLCVLFSASTPMEDPFQALTFVLMKDDEILSEAKLADDDISNLKAHAQTQQDQPNFSNGKKGQTAQAIMVLPNITIDEPCVLRVRLRTEREELKAPGLSIKVAPDNYVLTAS